MSPSAAKPLVEHVAVLRKRLGSQEPFHAEVTFDDLAITTARVPADEPVGGDLVLEASSEGVGAAGTVRFTWEGDCRRCRRTVRGEESLDVRVSFERDPVEGETYPLGIDTVDLEPVVREAVLVSLPLAPLCGDDCAGPAPGEFPATVEGEGEERAEGEEPPKDPRWAALDGLEFDQ